VYQWCELNPVEGLVIGAAVYQWCELNPVEGLVWCLWCLTPLSTIFLSPLKL
jgi:energy-converting hydrogenase Eha subunit G